MFIWRKKLSMDVLGKREKLILSQKYLQTARPNVENANNTWHAAPGMLRN